MEIVIIGAGNIATHYAKAFHSLNHKISQIYNRTSANAEALADVVSAQAINEISQVNLKADLYIIAVTDQYIPHIVQQLSSSIKGIIVHTSGATPISVLQKFTKSGVIYPLQSLNKDIANDLSHIPFAIEGSTCEIEHFLLEHLKKISLKSFRCNSQQRLALHIAAVFANNFTNALFIISESLLKKENLDFELIKPIILETAKKVQNHSPQAVQTGPAIRNDKKTINKHLEFLSCSEDLTQIYQNLTNFIIKRQEK